MYIQTGFVEIKTCYVDLRKIMLILMKFDVVYVCVLGRERKTDREKECTTYTNTSVSN